MNETEQFAEESKSILDQPLNLEPEKVEEKQEEEEQEEDPQNRRERRLRDRLEKERIANIELNAKYSALSEAQKFRQENTEADYLKAVERIYGTDSPEATAATGLLKDALRGVEERATKSALEQFREEQRQAQERVRKEEETLDSYIEEIEDAHGITMTPQMQKSYFTLLEKMSPKDDEGNVVAYADPEAVYEVFSEKLSNRTDNRAKELSSRSMVQGASGSSSKIEDDAAKRLLREAGIL